MGFSGLAIITIMLAMSVGITFVNLGPDLLHQRNDQTLVSLEALKKAIELYRTHHGGVGPPTLANLVTLVAPPCAVDTNSASPTYRTIQGWCGPYVDVSVSQNPNGYMIDEWGTTITFTPTEVRSCGPNRSCGDADDIFIAL